MSDVNFDAPEPEDQALELPAALPVLPLKETVVFPQSMTPLAIGQERSVRLIDDVVSGDRLLALVTSKDASVESPGSSACTSTTGSTATRTCSASSARCPTCSSTRPRSKR
jgi:Lon protease-like protein